MVLLVKESIRLGSVFDLAVGFAIGAVTFGFAQHQIRHKTGMDNGLSEEEKIKRMLRNTGRLAIIATILDSVPETLFIGIIIALREPGIFTAEIVIFMGNLATVLEAAKIMHAQGIGRREILRDWLIDFAIVAVAAPAGYFLAKAVLGDLLAAVLGFAAGALIVFVAGELISRAYRESTGHAEDASISLGFIIGIILLFATF